MAATNVKVKKNSGSGLMATKEASSGGEKIDPRAPAGTKQSLGAESVRDGRPTTDDSTVEAMDEEGPEPVK